MSKSEEVKISDNNLQDSVVKEISKLGISDEPHIPRPPAEFAENIYWGDSNDNNETNIEQNSISMLTEHLKSAQKQIFDALNLLNNDSVPDIKYEKVPFPLEHKSNDKNNVSDLLSENNKLNALNIELNEEHERNTQALSVYEQEINELRELRKQHEIKEKELNELFNFQKTQISFYDTLLKDIFCDYTSLNKKIKYKNGCFFGQTNEENVPSGFGFWKDDDSNDKYIGYYLNGLKSGFGIRISINGDNFKGEWENDKMNGLGLLKYVDNSQYFGFFKNGQRCGEGTFSSSNGEKYIGHWKCGKRDGFGINTYSDKSCYKGSWKNGSCHGKGHLVSSDMYEYDGDWENGLEHGEGIWKENDGQKYSGSWKLGKKCGKGIFRHKEGWTYDGNWENDRRSGYGVLTYFDGAKYEGNWVYDKRNGQGKYKYPSGDEYNGHWEDGLANGKGIYTFNDDGAIYEGEFKNGWPNGEGKFTFPSGYCIERIWREHLPEGYRVHVPWQKKFMI